MTVETSYYLPENPIRVITAAALFDGHDAAINIIRRILQDAGAEVIHLGHNRSVSEIVDAAVCEDVQGIAVSSYQGGHVEFFSFLVDQLKSNGLGHIKIFGGGGGVITPLEINRLHQYGVTRIYSPDDGARMGLAGMINDMLQLMDFSPACFHEPACKNLSVTDHREIGAMISYVRKGLDGKRKISGSQFKAIGKRAEKSPAPVIGITGTGGAGKSSLTDELLLRMTADFPDLNIAVICCDPSRRKTGGALLGDRIRMNAIHSSGIFVRSLATRSAQTELPEVLPHAVNVLKAAGFDLIIVETAGIGQADSRVVDLCDISVYVMTAEYGSPSQLEKIDMLDYADIVVINKFEKKGSLDAFKDVCKQIQRNRKAFDVSPDKMPVYGTMAARFNDPGVTCFYLALMEQIENIKETSFKGISLPGKNPENKRPDSGTGVIPAERSGYLAQISSSIRAYHEATISQSNAVRERWHLKKTLELMDQSDADQETRHLKKMLKKADAGVEKLTDQALDRFYENCRRFEPGEMVSGSCDQALFTQTLSGTKVPRVCIPHFEDPGAAFSWIRKENFSGVFPYTAGVFELKRKDEDPTRMFAGEGGPEETNKRFRLLSQDQEARRLSTAFDSVTLYGFDPDLRPDIYGKVGTSGVSICTLDDMKRLYRGFDLCDPKTSVSMTINGPAPIILAMFLNTAVSQQAEKKNSGKKLSSKELEKIKEFAFSNVRGTVQADILKEDQGQNTCIFSTKFALKMMGDIQQYFITQKIKKFYSVSISGYHIAEAGANPITQLALTLANGFTYVEYYLARGMKIDEFAPSLSFFFSNGMDPEYTVIGRVARRIWAIVMKHRYGAGERSQKLKYHVQTSGRSLHSREIQFNDIRTTLQGLCAVYDNCNSLHTNAFDEAITTPSAESVRRALAIQMIINREWGLTLNDNPLQGSFIVDELTDLVEEAVLCEFERISERGGVLGAMETGYQRSRIQEESMRYEHLKHSGDIKLIGVNTFINPDPDAEVSPDRMTLSRATDEQKKRQIDRLAAFKEKHRNHSRPALEHLKRVVLEGENIFAALMETVKTCSLGQITQALYEVGGKYRRNM